MSGVRLGVEQHGNATLCRFAPNYRFAPGFSTLLVFRLKSTFSNWPAFIIPCERNVEHGRLIDPSEHYLDLLCMWTCIRCYHARP